MFDRSTKLRWRRRVRRSRQHVEGLGQQTEDGLERHLLRRMSKIYGIRRFMAAWLSLVIALAVGLVLQVRALNPYYLEPTYVPGGTYTEGVMGSFTNANPLYAAGGVDGAVSHLLFSSLLTYDASNNLVGDLATGWESDAEGMRYTVKLRDDVKWHDGQPLTADDVIFTYQTIQNPDAKSILQTSWAGIKLEKIDNFTVAFELPNTLSAFPYALTNGIVPKHLLQDTPPAQLRSIRFNTGEPVGSGPFKWDVLQVYGSTADTRQESIGMVAYEGYHRGRPKLERFVVRSFRDHGQMVQSYIDGQINAMVGAGSEVRQKPELDNSYTYNIPLTGQIMVFFKTSHQILGEQKVRQALVRATDQNKILEGLSLPVIAARAPLLKSQVGYDNNLTQLPFDQAAANKLLDEAGWAKDNNGFRAKDGVPLEFNLSAQSSTEYIYVTDALKQQWQQVGVKLEVILETEAELQTTVANHAYDSLLYGISIGNDPDVFAYWHSSQADPRAATRLNLSEYKSAAADRALAAGRTRAEPELRAAKYKPFLEAWRNDAPALALYQPSFLYITKSRVDGFNQQLMNNATERFSNAHNWMIRQELRQKQ